MPKSKIVKEVEVTPSPVAPIESVDTRYQESEITDPCWNCGAQLQNGNCTECGFDKSLLHNLDLEAEQAVERQKAQQAANK